MSLLSALGTDLRTIFKVIEDGILKPASTPKAAFDARLGDARVEPDAFDPEVTHAKYASLGLPVTTVGISADEVAQGDLGDCYFVAALSAVAARRPDLLQQNLVTHGDGTFTVTLHRPKQFGSLEQLGWIGRNLEGELEKWFHLTASEPVQVHLDDQIPMLAPTVPAFTRSMALSEWPALYEKAFAKLWGSYAGIIGGTPAQAMAALTGGTVGKLKVGEGAGAGDALYAKVSDALSKGQILCGLARVSDAPKNGVVSDHAYAILGAQVVGGKGWIQIRNPWGNEGDRWISADQFAESFGSVETCAV